MKNATGRGGAVVQFRLRPERAQAIIRQTAQDTENVILGRHTLERIEERDISDIEIYRILQKGHVMEEPKQTKKKEWKCKVVKRLLGGRDAAAITIILHGGKLFVKTIEWED